MPQFLPSFNLFHKLKGNCHCLLLLVLMFAVHISYAQDATRLKSVRNVPLIEGSINGKHAYFIIDTGSTVTLLNESLHKYYGFKLVSNEYFERHHLVGIGGKCSVKEVHSVKVRLGSYHLDFINKACRLDKISLYFANDNIKIAGIIGTDVLSVMGSRIDFKDNTIRLK